MWISISRPFAIPEEVKAAIRKLSDAGHVAYVVGGSVRDFLLERQAKDHDIATSASPDELSELFPNSIEVGKQFGVIKIPLAPNEILEIATFRKDIEYKDHRHPSKVEFGDPQADAERRDFSVNALYFDPKSQRILDLVEGLEDLKNKVLRAIGNPEKRFEEDALRLLRAVRFQSTLGFEIEDKTKTAIRKKSSLIKKVSSERIRDELNGIFKGKQAPEALELLSDLKILKYILPELETLRGVSQSQDQYPNIDLWEQNLKTFRYLTQQNPSPNVALIWGTLLHNVGKPVALKKNQADDRGTFNGHEIEGVKIAQKICKRLRFPNRETDLVCQIVSEQLKFTDVFRMREATLLKWIKQENFDELLRFHRAEASATDGNLAHYEFCNLRYQELLASPRPVQLIDGEDLIQLGFHPGPLFTEILETVENLSLEKKLSSKEEALEFVVKHFVE